MKKSYIAPVSQLKTVAVQNMMALSIMDGDDVQADDSEVLVKENNTFGENDDIWGQDW